MTQKRNYKTYSDEFKKRVDSPLAMVHRIHAESNGSAGARTKTQVSTDRDVPLNCYRATGLMEKLGLVSCQLAKHSYNKATQEHISDRNVLDLQFEPERPSQVCLGDVLLTG